MGSSPCRRLFLLGVAHPLWDNPFGCRVNIGGRCPNEAVIAKKATCGLGKSFCKKKGAWDELVLACVFV